MLDGTKHHLAWEKEIKTTGKLKIGETVIKFKNPKCEHFITVPYNEFWDMKGTIDCLDTPILYEFKTGKTHGLDFAATMQIPVYFLLSELVGIGVTKAILIHYNQYTKKTEYIVVWNNEEKTRAARNFIDTIGAEIYSYFKEKKIINQGVSK